MENCEVCNQTTASQFYRDDEGKTYHFLCAEKKLGIKFIFNQDKMRWEIKK